MNPPPTTHGRKILWATNTLQRIEERRASVGVEAKLCYSFADTRIFGRYGTLDEAFEGDETFEGKLEFGKGQWFIMEVVSDSDNKLDYNTVNTALNAIEAVWYGGPCMDGSPPQGAGTPERKALYALNLKEKFQTCAYIDRIYCFGLGSMTEKDPDGNLISRRLRQHLAVVDIANTLKQTFDRAPILYFADPLYTKDDKRLLSQLSSGFIDENVPPTPCIDDARAFKEINHSSLVITFGADWPFREIVADRAIEAYKDGRPALPAAMICISDRGLRPVCKRDIITPRVSWLLDQFQHKYRIADTLESYATFNESVLFMRERAQAAQPGPSA